jgi:hypothetical protein
MWGNHAGMWSSACEEAQYSPLAYDAMVASLQADRGAPSIATMSTGKSTIRKETPRSSNTRSRTGLTRTSRNSRAKLCRRSKIIYIERSP